MAEKAQEEAENLCVTPTCDTAFKHKHGDACTKTCICGKGELLYSGLNREPVYEEVLHPVHYNSHPSGVECIDVIKHMSLCVGTAVKHLWRVGLKPGSTEATDIKKAIEYLQFELDRIEQRKYQ